MPQSLVQNYLHIVFSTKNRQPLINELIENELFKYLSGTMKAMECPTINVGGYLDHVHLLAMMSRKLPLIKVMQELKANSSKWIKTKNRSLSDFYWQDGYGAFSVGFDQISIVSEYISNQKLHHQNQTFQQEYVQLLTDHKIEFDERYMWD